MTLIKDPVEGWVPAANLSNGGGSGSGIQSFVCDTPAANQNKEINISLKDGLTVAVKFVNGNTYGAIDTTNHTATGPTLLDKPIYCGGQQIGPGAIVAGDVHILTYDGTNEIWNDCTADVIYKNATEVKFRSGIWMNWDGTNLNINY